MVLGPSGTRRSAAGQSFVEFVLVLPILIVLVVTLGDFGRVYASGIAVEDAAREAADYTAFDDVAPNPSHFNTTDPNAVDAKDFTRAEALRRACAAVSALPDFSAISALCANPVAANCPATPGGFCQLVVEDTRGQQPWVSTCQINAAQTDVTCGWTVHVTITYDFHTFISYLPLSWASIPTTVHFVRESRYAVSALPSGV